ncbi:MAG: hypothetical protein TREMPRED_000589 [Tremellales sp. Tagirdzhanova-0007]|nr:MAG: hypothetical protein TREMPRED_000589 [Tremellales sp. Tagirdzhanova-0007]
MSYISTILITGGSSGLGYSTALLLAKSQPHLQIVIASRTGIEATASINAWTKQSNCSYIPLDLASHASTRTFVTTYLSKGFPPISGLLLNAGYQRANKLELSADGIELQFAINHVNHALLFFLLQSQLLPTARIIIVSSSAHDPAKARVPPPNFTTGEMAAHPPKGAKDDTIPEGQRRYALSKLCNVMFAYAIDERKTQPWVVMALDPGVMPTNLYRWIPGIIGSAVKWYFDSYVGRMFVNDLHPTEYVAETLVKMTVGPDYADARKSGKYYGSGGDETPSSKQSYEQALWKELWGWTVEHVSKGGETENMGKL